MFEETKTLTGRLGLWPQAMHRQQMLGLPVRLESDLAEAKARIESLEAALKPFAELADSYSDSFGDRLQLKVEESNNGDSTYSFTLGELRAAAKALNPE